MSKSIRRHRPLSGRLALVFLGVLGTGMTMCNTAGDQVVPGGSDTLPALDPDAPLPADSIVLPDYANAEFETDTVFEEMESVKGHVVIGFEAGTPVARIDATLADQSLVRIGWIGELDIVLARVLDDRSARTAHGQVVNATGVVGAALDYLVRDNATGERPVPMVAPDNDRPVQLGNDNLYQSWALYVMDAPPALALADRILGASTLASDYVAIVDGGFQLNREATGAHSLLVDSAGNRGLFRKIVKPSGIDFTATVARWKVGEVGVDSNFLIGATNDDHGLSVMAAGFADGPDLQGPGRHVRVRPVRDRVTVFGRVLSTGLGHLAALTQLANEHDENLRVINVSSSAVARFGEEWFVGRFREVLRVFENEGVIIVVSSGNEQIDADGAVQQLVPRFGTGRRGNPLFISTLVGASGTELPDRVNDPDFGSNSESSSSGAFATGAHISVAAPGFLTPTLKTDAAGAFVLDRLIGTSFAAPLVAGVLAELRALVPSADPVDIIEIVERTADPVASSNRVGHGRVNFWKAMLTLLNRNAPLDPPYLGIRLQIDSGFETPRLLPEGAFDEVLVNGVAVPNASPRRIRDYDPEIHDDNRYLIPADSMSRDFYDHAAMFTLEPNDLHAEGVVVLGVRDASADKPFFQYVFRPADLLAGDAPNATMDDFVATIDTYEPVAAVYGLVTDDQGRPVFGATITVRSGIGGGGAVRATTTTDANGYYIAYWNSQFSLEVVNVEVDVDGAVRTELASPGAYNVARVDFAVVGCAPDVLSDEAGVDVGNWTLYFYKDFDDSNGIGAGGDIRLSGSRLAPTISFGGQPATFVQIQQYPAGDIVMKHQCRVVFDVDHPENDIDTCATGFNGPVVYHNCDREVSECTETPQPLEPCGLYAAFVDPPGPGATASLVFRVNPD